ncbi:InterPro IPR001993 [Janthinobacterium sp. CG23_2]|nr:InterPro IPR001993 [Janthinobacterium sp. CG23_2]CUU27976.1 InterPro IPR001993 [Janthinobacterium sp. CG23_2]
MTAYKWQFAPRFRRNAFGWKSTTPILRIKEALTEIKAVAKKEPVLAAEGAVLFLEKLAPAIEQVDSSSGGIGSAVNRAIENLVPIIAKADVSRVVREKWLDRLFDALQEDAMPYLEYLEEFWGELCVTPETAAKWADDLSPMVTMMWDHCARTGEYGYSRSTTPCLSAMYAAGRHQELLELIAKSEYRHKSWHNRVWGAKALAAAGKGAEAIQYAENSKGLNAPLTAIAAFCESVLLEFGFADEAYARYAVEATYATANLATFKAIVKKYPGKPQETILRDLVASQPGQEGKWFAAANAASFFELAIELANRSPSDPRTLIRAARDFAVERPDFALAAGMTALRGIANGWGYDITSVDVLDAYAAVMAAAGASGVDETVVKADVRAIIAASSGGGEFVGNVLGRQLGP